MKHTRFKIRAFGSHIKEPINDEQQIKLNESPIKYPTNDKIKIEDCLLEMRKLIQESKSRGQDMNGFEARDRHIFVETDRLTESKYNSDDIEAWIGEVCRNVMSTAFNSYLNEEMNYDQIKVYCCQGILENISKFINKNRVEITPEFYSLVDKILKTNVLPYLGFKYPPSVSNDVNKRLNKVFKEVNNIEVITNDFFYNSQINLQYRESGVYNDFIMQVINQMIKIADSNAFSDQATDNKTNFEDFEEFMGDLFEKVYDQQWMIKGKRKKKVVKAGSLDEDGNDNSNYRQEEEKQKYKEQVKEYTHYLIGRKISQNVQEFDEFQIKSGFINIKNPTILRIITKWCEQLWEKFDNENYYIDRTEGITMLKGKQVNIIYPWLKKNLKAKMKAEKAMIEEYMKNIELNNYEQQHSIMDSQQTSNQAPFMSKHERICGKFSLKVVKNLENYIIVYLNRLIHGLMTVSKNVYPSMSGLHNWPDPPNLLSFKVGDLLRCKCTSKERQILRIYEQLQEISDNNPQKLKIIRIKNRLKLGTNDILINVRFNNCLTAEIQLKAQSRISESQFSLCSYNFSHLIYQMQRSYFGPISEMCSIWSNLDPKVTVFKKLIANELPTNQHEHLKDSYCFRNFKDHSLTAIDNTPFICSECGKAYSNNNYVIPHHNCTKCQYWKCALCSIKEREGSDLIDLVINDEQIRVNCKPMRCRQLPVYSVGTLIESKLKEIYYFMVVEAFEKKYLFKIVNNQSLQLFKELSTESLIKQFLQEYLIFELNSSFIKKISNINNKSAVKEQILPSYVRKCYKHKKQTLSLNILKEYDVEFEDFVKILSGTKQQKKCIKYIEMSSNEISSLEFITPEFSNLEFLNINKNNLKDLRNLEIFGKLKTLIANTNVIQYIPAQFCTLKLKYLSLYNNKLTHLPTEFAKLKELQILKLNNNQLTKFSDNFGQLQNLKELYASNNRINQINSLTCPKLQYIDLNQNQLTVLPREIEALSNLIYLTVKTNKIKAIEAQCSKLKKLKDLILSSNPITQFPILLYLAPELTNLNMSALNLSSLDLKDGYFPALKDLNLQKSEITSLAGIQSFKSTVSLNLSNNKLISLSGDYSKLINMKILQLSSNLLSELSPNFGELPQLKELYINSNNLTTFPPSFFEMRLEVLHFNENKFVTLPVQLTQMTSLKVLQFRNNEIEQLPVEMAAFQRLQTLNISYNKIKVIPQSMISLKKLNNLTFKGLPFTNMPAILLNFNTNFSDLKIQALPETIPKMENIKQLLFKNNEITSIPPSIAQIVNLQILNFDHNLLTSICDQIFDLPNLKYLSLAYNQIAAIPDKFGKLTQLKTLLLNNNMVEVIPSSLEYLIQAGLQLNFNQNPITYLPVWVLQHSKQFSNTAKLQLNTYKLKQLPRLPNASKYTELNFSNNQFSDIPQPIFECSLLKILNLDNNMIKDICPDVFNLSSLQILKLSNNKIQDLAGSFGKLKSLIQLNLFKNPIKQLSSTLKQIQLKVMRIDLACFEDLHQSNSLQYIHTKSLLFSEKNVEQLPQCFGEIGYLEQFLIKGHLLKSLPESFGQLSSLIKFQIQCKTFEFLPESIGDLSNLQTIKIANCQLSTLPQSFWKLTKLNSLSIMETKLEQISESIQNLVNLKQISVRGNQLTKLPNSMTKILGLQILNCKFNKIGELPVGIRNWRHHMRIIYAQKNQIRIIPKELEQLKELMRGELYLDGNPIEQIECLQFVMQKGNSSTKKLIDKIRENKIPAQKIEISA